MSKLHGIYTYDIPDRVTKGIEGVALDPVAPEKKDYLVMDIVPDIFVSGHVHGAGFEEYKGIKMINASTWQTQTEYQKSHNFNPDPGIMPIVHLGNGRVVMKSFMD